MFTGRCRIGVLAFLLALAPRAHAQSVTTGALTGRITDSTGGPIEGAQVQVLNVASGYAVGGTSRASGQYYVQGLEVGASYQITVRRIGFQPQSKTGVTVTLGEATRQDFTMAQQSAVLEVVHIAATPENPVTAPTHTGVATTISDSALRTLPTLNRNFTDFVELTPQVSTVQGLSGGGVNNRFNEIQIDGSNETDEFALGSTGQPGGQANATSIPIESVNQYQVLVSPYDVRQGYFSGLLVNAVTKSGTNDFHGSAYVYYRNQGYTRTEPYINTFQQSQYGFSLGGPIIPNKVHFFINPEFQRERAPAVGASFSNAFVPQDDITRFQRDLTTIGVPVGSAGKITNKNPLNNLFAKLDAALPLNTQLVVSFNYGDAYEDIFSRGFTSGTFGFSSNGYQFRDVKRDISAQFRTNIKGGAYNELTFGYDWIRDNRAPNVIAPQFTVLDGSNSIAAGSERFSQGNQLDQDLITVRDNLTIPIGSHAITIGTEDQFYSFRNLFTQSSYGVWTFASLDSLERDTASSYIIGVPLKGDGSVRPRASQYSGYLQDLWTVSSRLNLTLGVRLDVPVFDNKPPLNPGLDSAYGINTSDIPGASVQISPRIGFHWDMLGDESNQLYGGVGSFLGHPGFVWMSNAYQNGGIEGVGVLTCNGKPGSATAAPLFTNAAVKNPPQACGGGATARAGSEIDLVDKNFKYPQDLKASLGYNHALGDGWILTAEALYTHAIYAPFYKNEALAGPQASIVDPHGRTMYGTPSSFGSSPVLVQPRGTATPRTLILDVTNENRDYSYNLSAGVQKAFSHHLEASIFYTYSQARSVQDLTSSTAFSQYRFGMATAGNQNALDLHRSLFEVPHRIVVSGTWEAPSLTKLSTILIEQSGEHYSYVSNADLNGDGVTSNDPLYIPRNVNDPNEIQFTDLKKGGTVVATAGQQAQAFDTFISRESCMNHQRGHFMAFDSCSSPWQQIMNVSIEQAFRTYRLQNISFRLDVFDFPNLINNQWGRLNVPSSGFPGTATLLNVAKFVGNTPVFNFTPTPRYSYQNLNSVYQIQLSARYAF